MKWGMLMIKRMLGVLLVLIIALSTASQTLFAASVEDIMVADSTADEAVKNDSSADESKLMLAEKFDDADGMIIGKIGDVNDDTKANVKDSTLIQKHLAKIVYLNEKFKALSDVDNNKKLNIRDATILQKYIAKIEVECVVGFTLYERGTHTHNYIESVFEATCEKEGYTGYSCICGSEYMGNIIEAKGHNYSLKVVEPTCETEGYTLYKCKCGDNYKGDIVGKKPHEYFSKVVKPTCTSKGYTFNECKVCGYTEKTNEVDATDAHKYNSKNICSVCDIKKGAFDSLKSFVVDNGVYDADTHTFYVYLNTGYDVDIGTIAYDESDDVIFIGYNLMTEDGICKGDVGFTKDSPFYSFRASYPGVFSTYGPDNIKRDYSFADPDFIEVRYFYYNDVEVSEKVCFDFSVSLINAALAIYTYCEDELPVTLSDLGFTNFEVN